MDLEILVEDNILSPSLQPIPLIEMEDTQGDPFATSTRNHFKLEEEWQWGKYESTHDSCVRIAGPSRAFRPTARVHDEASLAFRFQIVNVDK